MIGYLLTLNGLDMYQGGNSVTALQMFGIITGTLHVLKSSGDVTLQRQWGTSEGTERVIINKYAVEPQKKTIR